MLIESPSPLGPEEERVPAGPITTVSTPVPTPPHGDHAPVPSEQSQHAAAGGPG